MTGWAYGRHRVGDHIGAVILFPNRNQALQEIRKRMARDQKEGFHKRYRILIDHRICEIIEPVEKTAVNWMKEGF